MRATWLIVFLLSLGVEIATVALVSIWFAVGAFAALIATFFTGNVLIQSAVFVVVSVIALLLTRPIMKKFKLGKFEPTNVDRLIGKQAEVIKEISSAEYGEVKIFGEVWMASSSHKIPVGSKVIIEKIDGAKLVVKKEGE